MKIDAGMSAARGKVLLSMCLFGTIGLFSRFLTLPSGLIAMVRGFVGMAFLLLVLAVRKRRVSAAAVRANLAVLLLSGAALGLNWTLMFEAYRYTTVATATLCYYLAPAFVVLASPIFFREKLTARKLLCVAAALLGMILVSGVLRQGITLSQLRGVLLSLGSAVLYAAVVLLNKKLEGVSAYDRTIVQLGTAAVVLLPYVLLTEDLAAVVFTPLAVLLLAVLGIVHTGVTYALYFSSLEVLPAQSAALLSYIDPVVAVLLSALVLHEPIGPGGIVGGVLVLGATLLGELLPERTAGGETPAGRKR